ncbi:flavin-containing monooxygenase [Sphingomonas sp.]|uniref:flavin-containing monooxygenase n=1 Tax=Sphingomonas sp. TaxID=28214 RepID=UPI002DD63CFC|nr:NAD(P)/FAD-dependent oxidoreductase [Sphingomonas sp.]
MVGAGFAGLYLLHRLRGQGLNVQVIERAPDVGGTWYWNRYPGARCDIESFDYSYSFSEDLQQQWSWSERYPAQPEILRYLRHVADRFDLRSGIRFDTSVTGAVFDAASARWTVTTDRGDQVSSRYLVMATGCLSVPTEPRFDGMDRFAGPIYRTFDWPSDPVSMADLDIAIVGTGSSAVQALPILAEQARQVTVFQRTPCFSAPANNRPTDPDQEAEIKRAYPARRAESRRSRGGFPMKRGTDFAADVSVEERESRLRAAWVAHPFVLTSAFADVLRDVDANAIVAEFVRDRIREKVADPHTAELLCPKDQLIGTKRMCLDTGYYEAFNRSNVRLVDVSQTPIERFTTNGIVVAGTEHRFDLIVLATGFDAMTGALLAIDIRGADGQLLSEKWAGGPMTYLGLTIAGFPNMFVVTGPGSPSVLTNMVTSIEQHVDWIADCLATLDREGASTIEALPDAESDWVAHVNDIAGTTLYPRGNSWYLGANVVGKPRIFMPYAGGLDAYREVCDAVASDGYRGFRIA